jgi:hypothetical protein
MLQIEQFVDAKIAAVGDGGIHVFRVLGLCRRVTGQKKAGGAGAAHSR